MNPWNVLFPFQHFMKNVSGMPQSKDMESFLKNMFTEWQKQQHSAQSTSEEPSPSTFSNPFFEAFNLNKHTSVSEKMDVQIFETHNDVFIRMPIKEKGSLKNIKIFHTSNTSIIEGYPSEEDHHVFTLPAIVKKKGATAQYRDHILEIRLAKANDLQYSEINVTEI
ncbi:Hsp20/alpha crystallin family protein [Bacillus sp. 1P06AnD]|uniref:Hsp20/alpha crystallin family protein n=1 Tax=Bacillus sp. 1P06AnD TaxID=3132208 RepID=UPI0039A2DF29